MSAFPAFARALPPGRIIVPFSALFRSPFQREKLPNRPMDLVEILIDLSHQLFGRPDRVVIYDEGLVAAKLDRHIVISRPGARLGNLELGDLIYLDPGLCLNF